MRGRSCRAGVPALAGALVVGALLTVPVMAARAQLPASSLSVRVGDAWREWWRSDAAPTQWTASLAAVTDAVSWTALSGGLSLGELPLAGVGEARRLRVVIVRVEPARHVLRVAVRRRAEGGHALPWTVDDAPDSAVLALNAGQFTSGGPWGWVVHEGVERRSPGVGPLAPAFVVDTAGRVRFLAPDSIAAARSGGTIREAFQSYPTLLAAGRVPDALADTGRGVDVMHRDARLGVGIMPDGAVLIALTRFDGLGAALSRAPFGLTTPEMAALMGALGCRDAIMLDGGISAQLLVRDSTGAVRAWRGMRTVPLGLIALPRR